MLILELMDYLTRLPPGAEVEWCTGNYFCIDAEVAHSCFPEIVSRDEFGLITLEDLFMAWKDRKE